MNDLYAFAMMIGGTFGVIVLAVAAGRPIAKGSRAGTDAAGRE